jgi:hypothetical protein
MWPFKHNNQEYDTDDFRSADTAQAIGHIKHFAQHAPLDVQQDVYQRHFAQMPYEHRQAIAQQVPRRYGVDPDDPAAMADGFAQFGRERPDMLERIFNHPLLIGGSVALAGLIVKHVHEHRERESDSRQSYDNDNQGAWWAGRPW